MILTGKVDRESNCSDALFYLNVWFSFFSFIVVYSELDALSFPEPECNMIFFFFFESYYEISS